MRTFINYNDLEISKEVLYTILWWKDEPYYNSILGISRRININVKLNPLF